MKRGSSLVYICSSTPTFTDFKSRPNFKFSENCLPKLVDYSFSDESDSGNDSQCSLDDKCSLDESWDRLQVSLDNLTTSFSSLDTSKTHFNPSGLNRRLHERASLRLKAEQSKEETRKLKVMGQLNDSFGSRKIKPKKKSIYEIFGSSKRRQQDVDLREDGAFRKPETSSKNVGLKRQTRSLPVLDAPKPLLDSSVLICEDERPAKRRRLDFTAISKFASKRISFRSKTKKTVQKRDVFDSPKRNCLFSCFRTSGSYTLNHFNS